MAVRDGCLLHGTYVQFPLRRGNHSSSLEACTVARERVPTLSAAHSSTSAFFCPSSFLSAAATIQLDNSSLCLEPAIDERDDDDDHRRENMPSLSYNSA